MRKILSATLAGVTLAASLAATAADARDLLIAAVVCPDPVVYIDDRWLYDVEGDLLPPTEVDLRTVAPQVLTEGSDVTIAACGYSTELARQAAATLAASGIEAEVIDLRVLNPFDPSIVQSSVEKTGRLVVVDGSWATAGMSAEVIASVLEGIDPGRLSARPRRVTLPPAPAPTSRVLEQAYYPTTDDVVAAALATLTG